MTNAITAAVPTSTHGEFAALDNVDFLWCQSGSLTALLGPARSVSPHPAADHQAGDEPDTGSIVIKRSDRHA